MKVAPQELSVGVGGTGLVRVELTVPAEMGDVFEDDVVVVASSTSGPATTNSAIVNLSVSNASSATHPH